MGRPFELIAIDIQENRETVLKMLRDEGITYTNLLDEDGRAASLFGVTSTPVKYLIDTEGNMIGAALGYSQWDKDEIKELIELLIADGQKQQGKQ